MSTIRAYVPVKLNSGEDLWLGGETAHHLVRVLRVRRGDTIVLFDGHGGEYPAIVVEVARQRIRVLPGAHSTRDVESPLKIRLIQGISRGERMDFVMQKATELGVRRISPVHTARSVVRLHGDRAKKRTGHWERIVQAACEQCGRNLRPVLDVAEDLDTVLAEAMRGLRLILHPAAPRSAVGRQPADGALNLLVGPEGGFTEEEVALAASRGFVPLSLGPRTLRTETAALAAIAILQARLGDM